MLGVHPVTITGMASQLTPSASVATMTDRLLHLTILKDFRQRIREKKKQKKVTKVQSRPRTKKQASKQRAKEQKENHPTGLELSDLQNPLTEPVRSNSSM